jgi:hypothetical protein
VNAWGRWFPKFGREAASGPGHGGAATICPRPFDHRPLGRPHDPRFPRWLRDPGGLPLVDEVIARQQPGDIAVLGREHDTDERDVATLTARGRGIGRARPQVTPIDRCRTPSKGSFPRLGKVTVSASRRAWPGRRHAACYRALPTPITSALSALDASFLGLEDVNCHMHIGAVAVFEGGPLVSDDGGIDIERVRALMEAGILAYSDEPLVSSDLRGDPHSSTFSAMDTLVIGKSRQGRLPVRQRVGIRCAGGRPGPLRGQQGPAAMNETTARCGGADAERQEEPWNPTA